MLMSLASVNLSPRNAKPNGILGPAVVTLNAFTLTVVFAGYAPIGTVTTGDPTMAAKPAANDVGRTTASRLLRWIAPRSVALPPRYKLAW